MARASALRLVGGLKPEMRYREDHELWVRMAAGGYRFRALPKVLTSLRLHSANLELKHHPDSGGGTGKLLEVYRDRGPLLPRVAFLLPASGRLAAVSPWCCTTPIGSRPSGHEVTVIAADNNLQCDWFPYRSFRTGAAFRGQGTGIRHSRGDLSGPRRTDGQSFSSRAEVSILSSRMRAVSIRATRQPTSRFCGRTARRWR